MNDSTNVANPSPRASGSARPIRIGSLATNYAIVLAVAALFVVLAIATPNFLSWDNIRNVLDQNAYLGVAACGATVVIIAGGFDLAVGAIFALTGVVAAWLAVNVDPAIGLLLGVVTGALLGLLSGALTSGLKVHSFLITLAVGIIASGLAVSVSGGFLIDASESRTMTWLSQDRVAGLPPTIIVFALVAVGLSLFLTRTTFGRRVFAVGGNPTAARIAGVPGSRTIAGTFVVSGITAAIAGLMVLARSGSGQADAAGSGTLALDAIAAVIIGGTSIYGGRGAIWRTVFGVLLLGLISNGMNLMNVAPQWQDITTGAVIVLAVALNALAGRS